MRRYAQGGLTVVFGVCVQHPELVAEHVQLEADVGAILAGQQCGELGLDL